MKEELITKIEKLSLEKDDIILVELQHNISNMDYSKIVDDFRKFYQMYKIENPFIITSNNMNFKTAKKEDIIRLLEQLKDGKK